MIEPPLDRCIVEDCGQPARRKGGGECIRHEIERLIQEGYQRMRTRKSNPMQARPITRGIKRLMMGAIQTIKGE